MLSERPKPSAPWNVMIFKRLFSFGMVLGIAFLLGLRHASDPDRVPRPVDFAPQAATVRARIPMRPGVDSLGVAAAAAVAFATLR